MPWAWANSASAASRSAGSTRPPGLADRVLEAEQALEGVVDVGSGSRSRTAIVVDVEHAVLARQEPRLDAGERRGAALLVDDDVGRARARRSRRRAGCASGSRSGFPSSRTGRRPPPPCRASGPPRPRARSPSGRRPRRRRPPRPRPSPCAWPGVGRVTVSERRSTIRIARQRIVPAWPWRCVPAVSAATPRSSRAATPGSAATSARSAPRAPRRWRACARTAAASWSPARAAPSVSSAALRTPPRPPRPPTPAAAARGRSRSTHQAGNASVNASAGSGSVVAATSPPWRSRSARGMVGGVGQRARASSAPGRTGRRRARALRTARSSAAPRRVSATARRYSAQHGALEVVHARAERDGVGVEAHEEARVLAARPVALPEPQVEMRPVGPLVGREAGVAGDAQDRAVHPRIGVDARDDLGQPLAPSPRRARVPARAGAPGTRPRGRGTSPGRCGRRGRAGRRRRRARSRGTTTCGHDTAAPLSRVWRGAVPTPSRTDR